MTLEVRLLRWTAYARLPLATSALSGLGAGLCAAGQAYFLTRAIAGVFLKGDSLSGVLPFILALAALSALRALLGFLSEQAGSAAARAVKDQVRERLAKRLVQMGPQALEGERSGQVTALLIQNVDALDGYFAQYLPQLALAALLPAALLAIILPLDLISGLALLLTGPLIPFFMALIGSQADQLTQKQWNTLSRMSAYLLDVLQGVTTLKMLGRSRDQGRRIEEASERYRQATMGVLRVTFLSALALELLSTIGTAVVAVEVGLRLLYGGMAFEPAFFILLLAPEFYLPLRNLGLRFHAGMAGAQAGKRIEEWMGGGTVEERTGGRVVETAPTIPKPRLRGVEEGDETGVEDTKAFDETLRLGGVDEEERAEVEETKGTFRMAERAVETAPTVPKPRLRGVKEGDKGGIEGGDEAGVVEGDNTGDEAGDRAGERDRGISIAFKHVTYVYPGRERAALRDVSFSLAGGERTAIVGRSGAGKTTLTRLLFGFITPGEGEICANGTSLAELSMEDWRRQIAWVPQQPGLFNATLGDNLRIAKPQATEEDLRRACREAHLLDWIDGLPQGFETRIGEGGARLSGGQAQRLALARAFLRDAPLLVLDEPAAHLDLEQEARLADSIDKLSENRTVLVIAHRLSTAMRANHILVMEAGRLVGSGDHAALLETCPEYRALLHAYQGGAA